MIDTHRFILNFVIQIFWIIIRIQLISSLFRTSLSKCINKVIGEAPELVAGEILGAVGVVVAIGLEFIINNNSIDVINGNVENVKM